MSGIKPFFITGAAAKIKLNDKTLAFCTDLSYSIEVITQTPKILGMYEGSSVEPLGYSVRGAFTVIRYAKDVKEAQGVHAPNGVAPAGNGIGNWGAAWDGSFLSRNGFGNDGRPNENLDPSRLSKGTTFDIQVYQKLDGGRLYGIANIRNVRITRSDFNMNKRGVAVQRFEFTALYADEDSFVADFSGKGQQNT